MKNDHDNQIATFAKQGYLDYKKVQLFRFAIKA